MTVLQSHISADKTENTMLYLLAMALLFAEIVIHSIWIDNFSVPFWSKTLYYLVYSGLNIGSIFYYQKRYPMVITEFKTCFISLGFSVLSLFLPVWKIVLQDADAAKTFVLITLLINGIKLVIYFLLIFINPYFFEDLERPERKEEVSEELKRTELLLNDPTKVYSEDLENLTPKVDFNISKGRLFILTVFGWILVCAFSFLFEYIETGKLLWPYKSIILGAFCGVLLILLQQLLQIFTTLLDGTMYSVSIFLIIVIVIFANGYQTPLPLLGMISEYFIFYLFLISSFSGSILLFYLQY